MFPQTALVKAFPSGGSVCSQAAFCVQPAKLIQQTQPLLTSAIVLAPSPTVEGAQLKSEACFISSRNKSSLQVGRGRADVHLSVLPAQTLQLHSSPKPVHTCPQPCAQNDSIYSRSFPQFRNITFVQAFSAFPESSQLNSPSFSPKFHNPNFFSLHEPFLKVFMKVFKPILTKSKAGTGRIKGLQKI